MPGAALVHGIPGDRFRTELVRGLVAFGAQVGTQIVAEGVETIEELATLEQLGIDVGQGWLLGRPSSTRDLRW